MALSDKIEAFIIELLKEEDTDWLEIGRNELASVFNCVPSQINYVISTRFSPEKGYYVESRRGGGGYVRIKRAEKHSGDDIKLIIENIGKDISYNKSEDIINYLYKTERLQETEAAIIKAAISPASLATSKQETELRANILKNILTKVL